MPLAQIARSCACRVGEAGRRCGMPFLGDDRLGQLNGAARYVIRSCGEGAWSQVRDGPLIPPFPMHLRLRILHPAALPVPSESRRVEGGAEA